jgi:uncharacterized RDD family membrane protein YckC
VSNVNLGDPNFDITRASVGERAGGYLIDVIPAVIAALALGWIPILGAILAGFVLGFYWLFRDVLGASLGKLLVRTRIVGPDGAPAGIGRRILRNLPIAFGPSLLIIPFLGYAIAPVISGLIILTEVIMVSSQNERLGDRLAGTTVVRR